jgi:hypothetical protein
MEMGKLQGKVAVMTEAVDRAALTPIFPDPEKLSGADPYTFPSVAPMVFILGAGLFSVDTPMVKKVRTAR